MASILGDAVLDSGLSILDTGTDRIYIVSADPTTYTQASSTNALGIKDFGAGGCFGSPAAGSPNGRKVSSTAITDGSVTATGTATGWAAVTSGSSRLDANGQLSASQAVTSGNQFTLPTFDIRKPNQ
jgi:hypothetical protein